MPYAPPAASDDPDGPEPAPGAGGAVPGIPIASADQQRDAPGCGQNRLVPDLEDAGGELAGIRTGRLEAFSDGVFAIAITLLVLEIGIPAGSEHRLLRAILEQWPSYLAYVVSFANIGAAW